MNYDNKKYKIWDWKSLVILHWILNPGLIFNELFLGQTIPRIMWIEREGTKPFYQRSLIPCPHCGELHSGMKWSLQNKTAFKNWFGLYCDHCKKIIPVQRNLTTLLVLIVTFPIWGWFRKSLQQNWMDKQAERYKNLNLETSVKISTNKSWIILGLVFGLFMFISMQIVWPLIEGEEITRPKLIVGLLFWIVGGLAWGYFMKLTMNKKGKKKAAGNKRFI